MSLRKDISHLSFKNKELGLDNPLPTNDVDRNQRDSLNTIFGEKIVGIRSADIAAQFQYGYPSSAANAELLNGGSIITENSLLILSSGINVNGLARISNKKALRYIPGHEAYIYFTCVFTEGVENSYQRTGIFDSLNGFFIGYEGSNFTVTRRRGGIDYNTTINLSDVFTNFNPTKGNIYKISYGYLGFATISYEILKPDGSYAIIYKEEYPNTSELSHITNTNLPPRLEVANTGNNTDIIAKTASFTAGIVNGGGKDPASRKFTVDVLDQSIIAGEKIAITLKSKNEFNSITNYIESLLSLVSASTELSKNSIWEFRKNMTITNTPTWVDVDTDSVMQYSTDAIVTSGTGKLGLAFSMIKTDKFFQFVEELENPIFPNETMTVLIKTPLGTSGTYDLVLRWKELF